MLLCMYVVIISVYTGPPALTVNIIKNTTNSSIVVQWDAVDDFLPTAYTIIWTDDRDLYEVDTVEEQASYTITGLTLDTVYTITVIAANSCGDGPDFRTRVLLSTDTTSTTSTISPTLSPTLTASTTPIISTADPSSTATTTAVTSSSAINTATITTLCTTTVTTVINSSIVILTAITYPSITTITNIVDIPIPTDTFTGDETSKFTNMITKCLLPTLP